MKKEEWESEYTKHVRIKPEKHMLINKKRGKKTIAGKLDEIIEEWDKKNNQ